MSNSLSGKIGSVLGRVVAFVLLVACLPALGLIGFLLRTNTDEPVLLADEVVRTDATRVRIHRFRTTGRGTKAFCAIGRFIRSVGYDVLPALWDVLRGQIDLLQFYHWNKKR